MPRKKKEDDITAEIEAEVGESEMTDAERESVDLSDSEKDAPAYLDGQEESSDTQEKDDNPEDSAETAEVEAILVTPPDTSEGGPDQGDLPEPELEPEFLPVLSGIESGDEPHILMPEAEFPIKSEDMDALSGLDTAEAAEEKSTAAGLAVKAPSAAARRRNSFYGLNLSKLDRDLTPEQAQEWNSIYASYRSHSILSGMAIGVDQNRFEISGTDGESQVTTIRSLIIIDYRVKILIPETELWAQGEERPQYVMPNMVGSFMDYIILEVDREGECAIASRRMALTSKRYLFARSEHNEGERLTCKLVAVGPKVCTVECNGFDIQLTQRDLTYSAIPDLREKYRPGMELDCVLKQYDKAAGKLEISVKEALLNPFDGADKRHPIGSRRHAVISGKYRGGVFCTLPDGTVCHCLYSSRHSDADFRDGDSVIITIREYNYGKQQIFGRILTKW